jgi:N-acetylmuramoyl-L-alanine amidase
MSRRIAVLAGLLLLAGPPVPAAAERPDALELRARGVALGRVPLVLIEREAYVPAERLAAVLKGTWTVQNGKGLLTVGGRTAQFAVNQARVLLMGAPMRLESPPRRNGAGWLLPDEFVHRGLGRLVPGATVVAVSLVKPPPGGGPPPRAPAHEVAFGDLRVRSYPSFTRTVVETAGELPYQVEVSGREVLVRLPGLVLPGPQAQEVDDGLVKELQLEPGPGPARLRLTLEGAAGEIKSFVLADPFRVVIDVHRPREEAPAAGPRPAGDPLRVIVIDPGHGGHDPGAIGPSGLPEKEVVLDVARRLARMVEEGLGVKVLMTRSNDVFVPLRDRTNFANKQRADLFVSIHANAHPRSVSEGVETYFLSSEASDSEARQVAAIENGVVQLERGPGRRGGDTLKNILWDLAQSSFQQESSFLAETVLDFMTRSLKLVNRGVKQAGFYVLGGAAMPAVLVEIGFLTNPREERKLASAEYREAAARAIYAGLAEYKRRWDRGIRTAQGAAPAARPEPR